MVKMKYDTMAKIQKRFNREVREMFTEKELDFVHWFTNEDRGSVYVAICEFKGREIELHLNKKNGVITRCYN